MALRLSCALYKVENAGKFNHIFDTILGHFIPMALDWSNDLFREEFRKELQRYSQEVKSLALQLKLTTNRSSLQLLARRFVGVYLTIKPLYPFPFFELSDLITQDSSL